MREIKFRVWNISEKVMQSFPSIGIDYTNLPMCTAHGTKSTHFHLDILFAGLKEVSEIMQFTGLKDKNGKEVYEGDIIKCQQGCAHEIKWDQEIGGTYGGGMPGWHLEGTAKNNGRGYAWTSEEEVIGNVFENPELLPNK